VFVLEFAGRSVVAFKGEGVLLKLGFVVGKKKKKKKKRIS